MPPGPAHGLPYGLARGPAQGLKRGLERLYERYNSREYIDTDPLGYVWRYRSAADREVVGLLAASLAFGRVQQIRRSLERLLDVLGPPSAALDSVSPRRLRSRVASFRHRFVDGQEVADLLDGVRALRARWGSLNRYFVRQCYDPALRRGEDMLGALTRFTAGLCETRGRPSYLLPSPHRGSACKRLHLYLRWMVRRDAVDPGVWSGVRVSDLIIPMDTHMHRICLLLGFVDRKQPSGAAALQATAAFRRIRPDDPVRYDFTLTRIGMAGRLEELGLRSPPSET